ncbi:hypothetical protein [Amycolatopsis sp. PS_44_ISF1]|uniref:hypothetical protein n=1 Tax=Amycolatopsis sp. PS_44_ISF1 TaxID=2974917 RepID=UPI0028DDC8ED|nr:hypothetical protein [Amycolatopsis sp. PS_44_ISF1]MDT8910909.1 hypothetical protein [Amycolatopsis sp. PS_44_ISF1]
MTDHNGRETPERVWAVYYLPQPPSMPEPLVLWTAPDSTIGAASCRWCTRVGNEGACPGGKAHAFAQHAWLSTRATFGPLEVDVFELPPHVSVQACATNLYGLIVRRVKENRPPGDGPADERA